MGYRPGKGEGMRGVGQGWFEPSPEGRSGAHWDPIRTGILEPTNHPTHPRIPNNQVGGSARAAQ